MKNQSLILLIVAVGCGLVAMLGVKQVISRPDGYGEELVGVLTAVTDIQPGAHLDNVNTKFVEIAVSVVPEDAVLKMEDVAERSVRVPVVAGDWILKTKLTEKGQIGAEASIPPEMATVTIPVDGTTSHSGMIQPGNRIDLLLTYADLERGSSQQKTITVLEFVEVFAVDNRIYGIDKSGDAQAKHITLLVTPEQGKAVTLASRISGGNLSTMMRARGKETSNGHTEISAEFLKSSFMGSNRHAPSVMDTRELFKSRETDTELLPNEQQMSEAEVVDSTRPQSISDKLDQELNRTATKDPGGSGPIVQLTSTETKNYWTMEIYEGETLRLEAVKLPDTNDKSDRRNSGDWSVWKIWN